ncbi:MAG: aminoacetone oxidase family FAD-binding enzyme [Ruminococcus sp.]|nr:aminoacetone oxidase family FAD-binding enzyme [Ruminococcus sp.]
MNGRYYDIAVVGGGASGLTAAISAKEVCPEAKIAVVERLPRVGRKIIATGNGKCNLSNLNIDEGNYHGSVKALSVIRKMPGYRTFFSDYLGVVCAFGSEGREGGIYPRSNSSATIVNALRNRLKQLGIEEICDWQVTGIASANGGFALTGVNEKISCKRLIIAAGGYAAPSFGTDGGVLRILRDMGYKVSKICPAVAPLRVDPSAVKGLKGVRVKGCISAVSGGKILRSEKGEMQFGENSISGICVFNLAYLFQQYEGKMLLSADLLPDFTEKELADYLFGIRTARAELPLEELLTGIFVKNLAVYVMKRAVDRNMTDKIAGLKNAEIMAVVKLVKDLRFEVSGCSGWQSAQATMGGIHSSCVDERLESRLHKGLYLCGEILDTAGDCGGYNLQWAWSSGMLAGGSCGKSVKINDRT